tara:strand:- start:540 stop:1319 length:780 start_codon:yes stop_codon:yes gene_type:complete
MEYDLKYLELIREALDSEVIVTGRNGSIKPLINKTIEIDLAKGFPVITTKKILWKKAIAEFCWIAQGRSDLKFLNENKINWWDSWADEKNNIPKSYGYQLRNYNNEVDQIKYVIEELNSQEHSRRAYMTLWNPSDLYDQSLPCCYTGFNFYKIGEELHTVMNFRSSDIFLGLPFDIIVGAMFAHYIASQTGLTPRKLHLSIANAHLYMEHEEAAKELAKRLPCIAVPNLLVEEWETLSPESFHIVNYEHNEFIKAPLIC